MNRQPDNQRADRIRRAMFTAAQDGSVIVFTGVGTNDLLVDEGTLRDAEAVIASWAATAAMPTLVYSEARGLRAKNAPDGPRARVPSGVDIGTPPELALDIILEAMSRGNEPTTLIVQFAEGQLPEDHGGASGAVTSRMIELFAGCATDPAWKDAKHRIVLVTRTGPIDQRLIRLPGVSVVELALPEQVERRRALELMVSSRRHPLVLDPRLPLDQAARVAGGLPIDDVSRLRYQTSPRQPLKLETILERKKQAIRQMAGDTLVVNDNPPDLDTEVAGLPQIRRLVEEERDNGSYSLRVIICGPPGNGKSWVANAIAGALGVPAMSLGRIEGRWVGESQDNLRRAFSTLDANLPGCLRVEEIDQSMLSRRGEQPGDGSNVKADLRAMFFEYLGDVGDRNGLSVIGMTNRPDLLDEASSDRFAKIPVLHPDASESARIMAIQARRAGLDFDTEEAEEALNAVGDAFSGRQLVRMLSSAQLHAGKAGRTRIGGADVAWAISDSMERIGPEEERMALLAVAATSYNRHLPWNAARYMGKTDAKPPKYLEPFVYSDGRVDMVSLRARIAQLEHHGS